MSEADEAATRSLVICIASLCIVAHGMSSRAVEDCCSLNGPKTAPALRVTRNPLFTLASPAFWSRLNSLFVTHVRKRKRSCYGTFRQGAGLSMEIAEY